MSKKFIQEPTTDNPKQTFENAIARVQGSGSLPRSQTPIAVRPRPRTEMNLDQGADKRALLDAARALARLWNVSATLVR